mgnify:CR=1 FL=1
MKKILLSFIAALGLVAGAAHAAGGGMPLDKAWQCLHLYCEQVLAPLPAEQGR